MRGAGVMVRIPKHILLPIVLLLTLTAIYVQDPRMTAIWFAIGFGIVGYAMRRVAMSPLPFVIAFILGGKLEESARQAFAARGWWFPQRPCLIFVASAFGFVFYSLRQPKETSS